jgi:hypothetical protein
MVRQASQTWRGSESPGGTRNVTGAPQLLQNFMAVFVAAGTIR